MYSPGSIDDWQHLGFPAGEQLTTLNLKLWDRRLGLRF
jgi:hypothetical protein